MTNCLSALVLLVWSGVADHLQRHYVTDATFGPATLGFSVLPRWVVTKPTRTMQGCEPPCFNPGLSLLPGAFAAKLREALGLNATPTYLASFRRSNSLCSQLDARRRLGTKNGHIHTSFAVLDEVMAVVANVTSIQNRLGDEVSWLDPMSCPYEDVRLESGAQSGDRVLVHGMNYQKGYPRWHVWWFELNVVETIKHVEVRAVVRDFSHPDVKLTGYLPEVRNGRNYGILWAGTDDDPFHVVYWLNTYLDVRRGIPSGAKNPHYGKLVPHGDSLPLFDPVTGQHPLHNSGSPLNLATIACPGVLLALGHSHIDTQLAKGKEHGMTKFGNTYIHAFVAYNATPPYARLAVSPAFCFSTVGDNTRAQCDVIQFVAGMTRSTPDDPTKILLSYGINDCEPAYLEIDLLSALRFTSKRLAYHTCTKHSGPRRHRSRLSPEVRLGSMLAPPRIN